MRIKRKLLVILVIAILAFTIVEIYAHTYVKSLETVSEKDALRYMARYIEGPYSLSYYNASQVFSRTVGAAKSEWLVILYGGNPNRSRTAYIYIFKVYQSGSLLVQNLELVPLKADLLITSIYETEGFGHSREIIYNIPANYTAIPVQYDMNLFPMTYFFQFNLTFKVYAKTLLGYIPVEEVKMSMNVTIQL